MNTNLFQVFLNEFTQILDCNDKITEYDIYPFADENIDNLFIRFKDKLAINSIFLKQIIPTLCYQLSEIKKNFLEKIIPDIDKEKVFLLTFTILLLIPDHRTAWNIRKKLYLQSLLTINDDLNLTNLILNKHPKSYETIAQRTWLLKILHPEPICLQHNRNDTTQQYKNADHKEIDLNLKKEDYVKLLGGELDLCSNIGDKYSCNYALWDYRRFVFNVIITQLDSIEEIFNVLKKEISNLYSFTSTHISDSSSFSYHQFLIAKYISFIKLKENEPKDYSELDILLRHELNCSKELIEFYPNHECHWLFRKFVLMKMVQTSKELNVQLINKQSIISEKNWTQKMNDISTYNIWPYKHLMWINKFILESLN